MPADVDQLRSVIARAEDHQGKLASALVKLEDRITDLMATAPLKDGELFDLEWSIQARVELRTAIEQEYLATEETWVTEQLQREFWKSFYEDMKTWEFNDMRENDERVYKAIIVLFESKDDIEIFNKKAIYLYLREITGLNTKQVVNSLNKFREHYRDFKSDWESGKI